MKRIMKTTQAVLWLAATTSCLVVNPVRAQSASALGGQLRMGVNITGTVSTVWAIEATTNLQSSGDWACLALVQLPTTNYLWVDASAPASGTRFYRAVATMTPGMAFIAAGSFRLGSPTNEVDRSADEGPQTVVTLTKGFYMGRTPVTQGDYLSVVGANPSYFQGDLTRPVERVTWNDATNYCAQRTRQETAAGQIPAGCGYRLPTEAEWEYACRAWTADRRLYYADDPGYTSLANYAWYNANSVTTTHSAGQKQPNAWGLHDMLGNVWEWCQDWYGAYAGGSATDPLGAPLGPGRVVRGGSWNFDARFCRSAQRAYSFPTNALNYIGFRVVLAPGL
jgi:formylglycine-generating enzyme required for sulfatase activity